MEKDQELEWAEAQKIVISKNLAAAAKQQLEFLATVDRNRCLYDEGPALDRAIYRYKNCWLPLLAKHAESQISEGPLVVPLDCEWIWHCHRLNPIRYKTDCEELYGRLLDNWNVISSVQGKSKRQTEEIWSRMYPYEPYELDLSSHSLKDKSENILGDSKGSEYDLVSAVKRQTSFFYQVSRPYMNNNVFLEEAMARYRGFLHLIKRNRERSINHFCVPTYDIDLIWHSHQLHPASYCKDTVAVLGKVLEHDDTDSDRTKGKKLDVGFSGTTKQWEKTYGSRYWKAGAMYKGNAPSSLTINFCPMDTVRKKAIPPIECQNVIQLPKKMLVEVMLEIVGVRNLPARHKGSLFVSCTKKQPDLLLNTRRRLSVVSKSGKKQVAAFQCEPTGELLIELISYSPSNLSIARPVEIMGTTLISLQDLLNPVSKLSVEKWFDLMPSSEILIYEPISLRIALSFTAPVLAPYRLHMVRSPSFSSCLFPLPERVQHPNGWTWVVNEAGNEIISIQMRDLKKPEGDNCIHKKEVIGETGSGATQVLAVFSETGWTLKGSQWIFQLEKTFCGEGHIFELKGSTEVTIFPGRKLAYETKSCETQENEEDFMTLVEFSAEDPHGKAVALLNLKYGFLQVEEEWLVQPGITLAFILSHILGKEDYNTFTNSGESLNGFSTALKEGVNICNMEDKKACQFSALESKVDIAMEFKKKDEEMMTQKDCTCCRGCGNKCGALLKSTVCGGCSSCGGGGGGKYGGVCSTEDAVSSGSCGGGGGCGGSGSCSSCGGGGCHQKLS